MWVGIIKYAKGLNETKRWRKETFAPFSCLIADESRQLIPSSPAFRLEFSLLPNTADYHSSNFELIRC